MVDITKALDLDELASKDSPIHNLDGRIKLISTVLIIVISAFSGNIFIPIALAKPSIPLKACLTSYPCNSRLIFINSLRLYHLLII